MTGLRESFDVAKRIALLQHIVEIQREGCYFKDVVNRYREDYEKLDSGLRNYRASCQSEKARRKFRTGLVRKTSETSLSKYVRIAFELGLLEFNYDSSIPKGGSLEPNAVSRVITSILTDESQYRSDSFSFEILPAMKCLVFALLLRKDYVFLLPLLYTIKHFPETLEVDTARRNLILPYTRNVMESMDIVARSPNRSVDSSIALYNRMAIIQKYSEKLKRGETPHGMLHVLDPRLHWLYDLKLIDYPRICADGCIHVADFWKLENESLKKFIKTSIDEGDMLLARYSKSVSLVKRETDIKAIIKRAIALLSEYYSKLVPLDAVVLLVYSISAGMGNPLWKREVVSALQENGYPLYRNYEGQLGFVQIDS